MANLTDEALSELVSTALDSMDISIASLITDGDTVGIVLQASTANRLLAIEGKKKVEAQLAEAGETRTVNVVTSLPRAEKQAPDGQGKMTKRPAPPKPLPLPGVRHVIAVASGKGGVGKSTTSVNLALSLKALRLKVGLLDVDIFGPSLPMLMNISDKPSAVDKVIQPLRAHDMPLMSIGFMIDPNEPVVWRGPRVMGATQQMLREVAWGDLDVLVVDMPPGTGDVQLTMVQQAPLSGAVIVSTPQDLALIDTRKGIAMFEKVKVPILGIIENMSQFICPACGHSSSIFGTGGARDEAEKLQVPFLGELALAMELRQCSDAGTPFVLEYPDHPIAKAYLSIAEQVASGLQVRI